MGFDEGRIVFDHENLLYNAGEIVHGKLAFNQEKNKTFRGMYAKIKGYCDVHWTTRHTRRVNDRDEHYTVEHTSHETYFEQKIYLMGSQSGEVFLQPGYHEFPFQFLIPAHCPPSFEGSNGHIRYEVKVVIDRSLKFDQEKCMLLRVVNLKDLNRDPYCKEPMVFEFEETYCCWCMSQGICETSVKLPQSGYCPGQTINIELSCANKSNVEIKVIQFELIERRKYTAVHNADTIHEENIIAKLKKSSIAGNTTRNWMLEMDIPQMDLYNLDACQFIDIVHELKAILMLISLINLSRFKKMILVKYPIAKLNKGAIAGNTNRNWLFEMDIPQMDLYSLDASQFIDIVHELKVTVSPSGCHSDTEGTRRMVLGHIPLREFEGPPQGDQVIAQPVAPSMTQYPGNQNYPGNQQYPGQNPAFPPQPYPGPNPSFPGTNMPFPNSNGGVNPPYPGAYPSFPGANPPYPSQFPGVSPYPVGVDPTPKQPGFNFDHNNTPLLPTNPYPSNNPMVSPYAASAPPPGTPDFDGKWECNAKWRNTAFVSNLKKTEKNKPSPVKNRLYFYYFTQMIQLKIPLKAITRSLASGKVPKLLRKDSSNKRSVGKTKNEEKLETLPRYNPKFLSSGYPSENVFRPELLTPFSKTKAQFKLAVQRQTESAQLSEDAKHPFPFASESVQHTTRIADERTIVNHFKTIHAKVENSGDLEHNSKDMFLLSLLPELNAMTNRQLRVFKRRVIDLIEDIIENTPSTSTPNESSVIQDISLDGEINGTEKTFTE